jgi:hypothetical protein
MVYNIDTRSPQDLQVELSNVGKAVTLKVENGELTATTNGWSKFYEEILDKFTCPIFTLDRFMYFCHFSLNGFKPSNLGKY